MASISFSEAVNRLKDDQRVFVVTDNNTIIASAWLPVNQDASEIFDDWIEAYSYVLKFKTLARQQHIYGLNPVMFSCSEAVQLHDEKTGKAMPFPLFVVEEVLWFHGSLRRIRAAYDRGDDYNTMIQSLKL